MSSNSPTCVTRPDLDICGEACDFVGVRLCDLSCRGGKSDLSSGTAYGRHPLFRRQGFETPDIVDKLLNIDTCRSWIALRDMR